MPADIIFKTVYLRIIFLFKNFIIVPITYNFTKDILYELNALTRDHVNNLFVSLIMCQSVNLLSRISSVLRMCFLLGLHFMFYHSLIFASYHMVLDMSWDANLDYDSQNLAKLAFTI